MTSEKAIALWKLIVANKETGVSLGKLRAEHDRLTGNMVSNSAIETILSGAGFLFFSENGLVYPFYDPIEQLYYWYKVDVTYTGCGKSMQDCNDF